MNIATKSTDAHTKNYHMVQIIIVVVPGAPGRLPQIVSFLATLRTLQRTLPLSHSPLAPKLLCSRRAAGRLPRERAFIECWQRAGKEFQGQSRILPGSGSGQNLEAKTRSLPGGRSLPGARRRAPCGRRGRALAGRSAQWGPWVGPCRVWGRNSRCAGCWSHAGRSRPGATGPRIRCSGW